MKVTNATLVTISLVAATGCMNYRPVADQPQGGGTSPEFSSRTGQFATASGAPLAASATAIQPLNNLERGDRLIGEAVLTSDHQRSGKIDDFVVDQDTGQILYAIVGIGGLLGVGETRVAVPPALFTEARKGAVELAVDKGKLTRAPQVARDIDKNIKEEYLSNVYGYYGQAPGWKRVTGGEAAAIGAVRRVSELDGMKVINNAHQDIGKVENVVLDLPSGRVIYFVISPSSDLNLGNNYYALPPRALKVTTDEKTLVADLSREKLSRAPHFAKDDWSELSNTAWAQKLYQYYGLPATFQTGELQPTGRNLQPAPIYPRR